MSKWRRTSWQQLIIAQTNFLEYERTRLCPDDRENGVSGQRSSACHALRDTMHSPVPVSTMSWMVMMFGWFSDEAARAS